MYLCVYNKIVGGIISSSSWNRARYNRLRLIVVLKSATTLLWVLATSETEQRRIPSRKSLPKCVFVLLSDQEKEIERKRRKVEIETKGNSCVNQSVSVPMWICAPLVEYNTQKEKWWWKKKRRKSQSVRISYYVCNPCKLSKASNMITQLHHSGKQQIYDCWGIRGKGLQQQRKISLLERQNSGKKDTVEITRIISYKCGSPKWASDRRGTQLSLGRTNLQSSGPPITFA